LRVQTPTESGEFESDRCRPVSEEAFAVAQDDWVDEQAVLVDELLRHERPD
jgi:hypothetical protein